MATASARPRARHVLPRFTERAPGGRRTLDPYGKLLEERIVVLGTPIDDAAANDVIAQFMHLEHAAPERDVSLYINSPGGSFTAMTAIYDTLRYLSCDVETLCLGQAVSAAAVLLSAGTPGKRLVLPGARVTIHQPAPPEALRGQVDDLAIQARELRRRRDLMEELLVRHTGRSRARVAADLERERFLDAAQALEHGLVDRIVTTRAGSTPPAPSAR
ncbi:ClpP family protease [Streptomyces sp. LE64]|uniref:ClpP family protease n=1 Tax=Streptomyces sp. LE64 TaxID=3448653 RepID=UPI0040416543